MQTRTGVVVCGALTLALSLALGACSRKPHGAAQTDFIPPTVDGLHDAITKATESGDLRSADAAHRDDRALASAFPVLDDKPLRLPPPTDPQTRAELETKYHDSTPTEMQAALDSLLEVLDAQTHQRMQDKTLSPRNQVSALADEVGWLSERCAH
jgi:hypothetical protein